ncbi:MAG: dihydroorotate dehydrogenase electron transfer subunit [candidate division NC10 bacterium]|nr:dihydroorotate dehydrogenase electron transfer subunit [candidate division NC10 bacterium]
MRAQIAFNRSVSAPYRHLGIAAPGFPESFAPGQFVMVRPPLVTDPLLPRAFSIYRISQDGGTPVVEILYKILGKGTQCLSRMEPGREVEILGPLGNSFAIGSEVTTAVLAAGGIGVPPISALAAQIRNSQFAIRDLEVFLGGKTADDILCLKDFEAHGVSVHITTEDGSLGSRGLVTDLLGPFLLGSRLSALIIFTCGPPGMLSAVARLAETCGVPCQTSVEANMACGFGACMGCAIEARSSGPGPAYKLVCKDGPVFDSRELVWR